MKSSLKLQEKRKFERFELSVTARISIEGPEDSQGGKILELISRDICAGGAFFRTDQPLPEGTKVKIDLVLPLEHLKQIINHSDKVFIKITGTVLRSESSGMAICFDPNYKIQPLSSGN